MEWITIETWTNTGLLKSRQTLLTGCDVTDTSQAPAIRRRAEYTVRGTAMIDPAWEHWALSSWLESDLEGPWAQKKSHVLSLSLVALVQIQDAHCPEYAPSWKNVPQFPAEEIDPKAWFHCGIFLWQSHQTVHIAGQVSFLLQGRPIATASHQHPWLHLRDHMFFHSARVEALWNQCLFKTCKYSCLSHSRHSACLCSVTWSIGLCSANFKSGRPALRQTFFAKFRQLSGHVHQSVLWVKIWIAEVH